MSTTRWRLAECHRHMFSPKVGEAFVGEILYRSKGRTETDHDLYFDSGVPTLFVVTTESPCGGRRFTRRFERSLE